MFPDVRLLIAAMFASVVALSCGFGVFAALRVNHAPLGRMPPAIAPLQLATHGAAPSALTVAPPEPLGAPLSAEREPGGGSAIDSAALEPGHSGAAEPLSPSRFESEAAATTGVTSRPASVPAVPTAASAGESQAPSPPVQTTALQTPSGDEAKHDAAALSTPVQVLDAPAIAAAHDTGENSSADRPSGVPSAAAPDVTGSTHVATVAPATEPPAQPGGTSATEAKAEIDPTAKTNAKEDSAVSVQKPLAKPVHKAARNPPRRVVVQAPYPRRRVPAYTQYGEQSYGTTFQTAPDSYRAQ